MREPSVVRRGIIDCQVCVPANWTDEQVLSFAEKEYPSGTRGWHIRRQAGDHERVQCDQDPEMVHIMLDA